MLKKIIKILELGFLVLLTIMMMGCGNKVKDEADLQEDLLNSSSFYMAEDWEMKNFSIVKRMTDKENKKDVVYVSFDAGNEMGQRTGAYTMYYTQYNDGWRLDSIEEYHGDDVEYKFVALKGPEEAEILEKVKSYSDSIIWEFWEKYNHISVPGLYFFEEGSYEYSFENVDVDLDNGIYTATLIIDRNFELVKVHEMIDVKLEFSVSDYFSMGWHISYMETADVSNEWNVEGTWMHPDEEYPITISEPEYTGENYSVNVKYTLKDIFGQAHAMESSRGINTISSMYIVKNTLWLEESLGDSIERFTITPNAILDSNDNPEAWVRVD